MTLDVPEEILSTLKQTPAKSWKTRLKKMGHTGSVADRWIWRACGSGALGPIDDLIQEILLNNINTIDTESLLGVMTHMIRPSHDWRHPVEGWLTRVDQFLERAITEDPALVQARCPEMKVPIPIQAEVALFRAGHLEHLSQATLAMLTAAWLATNQDRESWWDALKECVSLPVWREACLEALRSVDVVVWHKASSLLRELDDAAFVNLIRRVEVQAEESRCGRRNTHGRYIVTGEIVRRGERLVEGLLSILGDSPELPLEGLLVVMANHGLPIPPAVDDALRIELGRGWRGPEYTRNLLEVLAEQDHPRAVRLVTECMGAHNRCTVLHGLLKDRRTIDALMAALRGNAYRRNPDSSLLERSTAGIALGAPEIVPMVSDAVSADEDIAGVHILVHALGYFASPEAIPGLLKALSHPSKPIRDTARANLLLCGEDALEGLEVYLGARRKATRESALAVLKEVAPGPRRDAFIDAHLATITKAPIREAMERLRGGAEEAATEGVSMFGQFKALAASITTKESNAIRGEWFKRTFETEAIQRFGIALLVARLPLLRRRTYAVEHTRWARGVAMFSDHALMPWIVAAAVGEASKDMVGHYVKVALQYQGRGLLGALCDVAKDAHRSDQAYALIGQVDPVGGADALIEALQDSSAPTRESAVKALAGAGVAVLPRAVEVLGSRPKDARVAAARVIEAIGDAAAVDALEAALAKEKNNQVATALGRALAACAPAQPFDIAEADEETLDRWLTALPVVQLPKGLEPEVLPAVRFASGRELSPSAQRGLLALLARESQDHLNLEARRLRLRLDREALEAFGEALLTAWDDAGRRKAWRWALDQFAVTATPRTADQWGYNLINYKHDTRWDVRVYAGWLACYGTEDSLSWLQRCTKKFGSAHNRIMRQQFALAASHRGVDVSELSAQYINPHFQDEISDIVYARLFGYDIHGQRSVEASGYQMVLRALQDDLPAPGVLCDGVSVCIASIAPIEGADVYRRDHALRFADEICKKDSLKLEASVQKLLERLQKACQEQRPWTAPGWRRLFTKSVLGRLIGVRALFRDGAGTCFGVGPDDTPVGLDGAPVDLDGEDVRITLVRPGTLTAAEIDAWATQSLGRAQAWCEARDSAIVFEPALNLHAGLSELRALLYEDPSPEQWAAICSLLDACADDDLSPALGYVMGHLERWEHTSRPALPSWVEALLGTGMEPPRPQPRLQVCNSVTVERQTLSLDVLMRLIRAEGLGSLRHLALEQCMFNLDGAEAFKRAEDFMPEAESLAITSGKGFSQRIWALLGGAACMRRAKHLNLNHNGLNDAALGELISAGAFEGVVRLELSHNAFTNDGVRALTHCEGLAGLKVLDLSWNAELDAVGMAHIKAAPFFNGLTTLNVRLCRDWHAARDLMASRSWDDV